MKSTSFSKKYEVKNNKTFPSLNRLSKLINKRNNHSHIAGTFFGVLESHLKTLKEFVANDASANSKILSDSEYIMDHKTTHRKYSSQRSSNVSLAKFMYPLSLEKLFRGDHLFYNSF